MKKLSKSWGRGNHKTSHIKLGQGHMDQDDGLNKIIIILFSTNKRERDVQSHTFSKIKKTGKNKTATNFFESCMMIDTCDWCIISQRIES